MFCRNCGNEVQGIAIACMKCGCNPNEGTNYCPNCGASTTEKQIVCVKCGVGLKEEVETKRTSTKKSTKRRRPPKDKTAAGLLAVFLGELGAHQFYLGNAAVGWIRLIIFAVASIMYVNGVANAEDGPLFVGGLTFFVMQVICLIEGIKYLTMSEEDFDETYVQNKRGWF